MLNHVEVLHVCIIANFRISCCYDASVVTTHSLYVIAEENQYWYCQWWYSWSWQCLSCQHHCWKTHIFNTECVQLLLPSSVSLHECFCRWKTICLTLILWSVWKRKHFCINLFRNWITLDKAWQMDPHPDPGRCDSAEFLAELLQWCRLLASWAVGPSTCHAFSADVHNKTRAKIFQKNIKEMFFFTC